MGRVSSPTFIGRSVEVDRLLALFQRAADGSAGAAVVAGEAGVGKSRLLAELAARVDASGGRVLIGGAVHFEVSLPYAPFVEALRPVITDADMSSVLGQSRSYLAVLFPELAADATPPPGDNDAAARTRLFGHLLALLRRMSLMAPVLVVVEDLHWADASTRDLFSFLARNLSDERLLMVCSYREEEVGRRHPLNAQLARLERDRQIERLELAAFDRHDFDRQLTAIRGRAVPAPLADRIFDRSGGNAFFTEELLASERISERGDVPASLMDALLARVDRLSPDTGTLLRTAAVAGREVAASLLAAIAKLPIEIVEAALREARAEQVLLPTDGDHYRFRHALLQEALYGETLASERIRLHFAVAEALSDEQASAAELAFHWVRAHRWPEALAASLRAADEAGGSYAFPEELEHLERAIGLWDRVPEAAERTVTDQVALAQRAALAAWRIGDPRRAASLTAFALAKTDATEAPLAAGGLAVRLADQLFFLDDTEGAEAALKQALALVPAHPPSRELLELLSVVRRWGQGSSRARGASLDPEQILLATERAGEPRLEAQARLVIGMTMHHGSDLAVTLEHLRVARQIGEALGDPELITESIHQQGHALDGGGRFEEAYETFRAGAARAKELGMELSIGRAMEIDGAESLRQLGRWADAEQIVGAALQALDRSGAYGSAIRHAIPAHLYVGLGRFADAERELAVAAERARHGGNSGALGHIYAARGEMAILRARWDEARMAIREGLDRIASTEDLRWIGTLAALGLRTEAERAGLDRARGRHAAVNEAIRIGQEMLQMARRTGERARRARWREGAGHLALAEAEWRELSGAPDSALWQHAAALWAELGQPYPEAYARLRWAQTLTRNREARGSAIEVLGDALRLATRIGATPLADAVTTHARGARLTISAPVDAVATRAPAHPYGLSRRESEVLALLAAGRTNRQIAAELYISENTAGVHVSHILAKLGATNRAEAAALAVRLELVDRPAYQRG